MDDQFTAPARLVAGATTSVAGLLTLLGINSERVWALLDDNQARNYLLAAVVLGVVAIALSVAVLVFRDHSTVVRGAVLTGAVVAYMGALVMCLFVAAEGANVGVQPSFEMVELHPTESGSGIEVAFRVTASQVDPGQGLRLRVVGPSETTLEATILRPNADGVITHESAIVIPDPDPGAVVVKVWRDDRDEPGCSETHFGATCVALEIPPSITADRSN